MKVRVVAAVVERDGNVLICERPHHKRHGGLWEFPGGKVERGESDLDAVRRELAEELGVTVVRVGEVEFSREDAGSEFVIQFIRAWVEGEPQCLEHASVAWMPLERLCELPLAPSDRAYVAYRIGAGAAGA
jgi:8-oxo-dGTP diphosphatase